MGDRVTFQVVNKAGEFGPVVYCHWSGEQTPEILARLRERMRGRPNDIDYSTARLVQEAINASPYADGNLSFGVLNADRIGTVDDSPGNAGHVLVYADLDHAWEPIDPDGDLRADWEAGKWGDHKKVIHG
jgi:hypothetical protein